VPHLQALAPYAGATQKELFIALEGLLRPCVRAGFPPYTAYDTVCLSVLVGHACCVCL